MEEKAPRPTKTGKRRAKKPIYYTESGYLGLERIWKILQPERRLSPCLSRMWTAALPPGVAPSPGQRQLVLTCSGGLSPSPWGSSLPRAGAPGPHLQRRRPGLSSPGGADERDSDSARGDTWPPHKPCPTGGHCLHLGTILTSEITRTWLLKLFPIIESLFSVSSLRNRGCLTPLRSLRTPPLRYIDLLILLTCPSPHIITASCCYGENV